MAKSKQAPKQETNKPTTPSIPAGLVDTLKAHPQTEFWYIATDGKGWFSDEARAKKNLEKYSRVKNPYYKE